jgi:isoleucyl-tRNA synthetase
LQFYLIFFLLDLGWQFFYNGSRVFEPQRAFMRVDPIPVFLPKTSFPMRGNLPHQEPSWLAWWELLGLYGLQRAQRKEAPLFVLHDGPPYANGPIHLGHALNKTLKDFVNRWKFMLGYDVSFVPGWDCHGLPIEVQVEKAHRTAKQKKSVTDVRQDCEAFAMQWIAVQKSQFQRLGVGGDWEHHYSTMDPLFESRVLHHLYRLMTLGYIYRGIRPVLWSASEKTALAESEVEYETITSKSVYVRFPIVKDGFPELEYTSAIIWTTTPWSLPGNRAIAYHTCAEYVLVQIGEIQPNSLMRKGEKILLAHERMEDFFQKTKCAGHVLKTIPGTALQGVMAIHPWSKEGYSFEVPLLPSEYVTMDAGTGLVHTAPCHGLEDFIIGQRYQLEVASPLNEEGRFEKSLPVVGGLLMEDSTEPILEALRRYGALAGEEDLEHSYPHSWRSKKPLFYRATPQWFIALDGVHHLRERCLSAIEKVRWVPETARNRMNTMMASRPDWCISRQRVWGVPIATFLHVESNIPLQDQEIYRRIEEKVAAEGTDFWFTDEAFSVLKGKYDPAEWKPVLDIVDVWFESGITHEVVLKDGIPHDAMKAISWPANLYLEGSDQHRAWFQSSLALSVALEDGKAPYEEVVTHGFALDDHGRKMSKSLGNVVDPLKIIEQKGADILRLWVAYEDFQKDLRAGPTVFARVEDMYRRFRNTLRYGLGGLAGFSVEELRPVETLPLLERWVHHRLFELNAELMILFNNYQFREMIHRIHLFCSQDLSAFYFDVCKDSLYCDAQNSCDRQGIRTTLLHIILVLIPWLAPFLCFTAEEAWSHFAKDILEIDPLKPLSENFSPLLDILEQEGLCSKTPYWSIHLARMPQLPDSWACKAAVRDIEQLRAVRSVVTSALEKAREEKRVRDRLEATPLVFLPTDFPEYASELMAKICVTSGVTLNYTSNLPQGAFTLAQHSGIGVIVAMAKGKKCVRCWRILPEVETECRRCLHIA